MSVSEQFEFILSKLVHLEERLHLTNVEISAALHAVDRRTSLKIGSLHEELKYYIDERDVFVFTLALQRSDNGLVDVREHVRDVQQSHVDWTIAVMEKLRTYVDE